jgi:hypothetical protein
VTYISEEKAMEEYMERRAKEDNPIGDPIDPPAYFHVEFNGKVMTTAKFMDFKNTFEAMPRQVGRVMSFAFNSEDYYIKYKRLKK